MSARLLVEAGREQPAGRCAHLCVCSLQDRAVPTADAQPPPGGPEGGDVVGVQGDREKGRAGGQC